MTDMLPICHASLLVFVWLSSVLSCKVFIFLYGGVSEVTMGKRTALPRLPVNSCSSQTGPVPVRLLINPSQHITSCLTNHVKTKSQLPLSIPTLFLQLEAPQTHPHRAAIIAQSVNCSHFLSLWTQLP